ncbi:BrnT family toxin [Inquilinus sp. Marseille-Q2685]|uniref:BrnT family toxin n=1 Tax=Inquilinus sp. Marseille-Q2685 TaxID=2866581 RepID=UPI001CE43DCD|nr:BrnT family toxin [Inquilinus sp. Marseille-Q2685]
MDIDFDPVKNAANIARRGLDFADAALMWREGPVVEIEDDRSDYGELRMIAVGRVRGRVCVAVYTDRGPVRRIISFRKANRREINAYQAWAAQQE